MTKEQIVGLAVRLFAVFLFFYIANETLNILLYIDSVSFTGRYSPLIPGAVYLSVLLLVCIVLWHFPLTVAKKLIPLDSDKAPEFTGQHSYTLAMIVLGLWALVDALPDTVTFVTVLSSAPEYLNTERELPPQVRARLYGLIVQLILGFWLLFGARGVRELLIMIRVLGSRSKGL